MVQHRTTLLAWKTPRKNLAYFSREITYSVDIYDPVQLEYYLMMATGNFLHDFTNASNNDLVNSFRGGSPTWCKCRQAQNLNDRKTFVSADIDSCTAIMKWHVCVLASLKEEQGPVSGLFCLRLSFLRSWGESMKLAPLGALGFVAVDPQNGGCAV